MLNRTVINIAQPPIGDEELSNLSEVLESGWLTHGKMTERFEAGITERLRIRNAVAVSSATAGLFLALKALEVGPGDEVVVPAFTWVSSATVVDLCGARPVFVDVDPTNFVAQADAISRMVGPKTKAVMPVHLFGYPVDISALRELLPENIAIVEDAACGLGAELHGHSVGSLGDVGVFSFHPRKIITTGEGGMVTTNNDALADVIRSLRNHGAEDAGSGPAAPYVMPAFERVGFNARLSDLQSAVGVAQLARLDHLLEERREWAAWYRSKLQILPWLRPPNEVSNGCHGWQAYVTMVDEESAPASRNEIMQYLAEHGVMTRPGTHAPPHLSVYKDRFGFGELDFPEAQKCERQSMALPLHNKMTDRDCERVVELLLEI